MYRLSFSSSSPRENCYSYSFYDIWTTTGLIESGVTLYYDSGGADVVSNAYWLIDDINCQYWDIAYPTGILTGFTGLCRDCI